MSIAAPSGAVKRYKSGVAFADAAVVDTEEVFGAVGAREGRSAG